MSMMFLSLLLDQSVTDETRPEPHSSVPEFYAEKKPEVLRNRLFQGSMRTSLSPELHPPGWQFDSAFSGAKLER